MIHCAFVGCLIIFHVLSLPFRLTCANVAFPPETFYLCHTVCCLVCVHIIRRFYHGHVDSVPDMYAGQIGPLIIYEEGVLDKNGMPTVSIVHHNCNQGLT